MLNSYSMFNAWVAQPVMMMTFLGSLLSAQTVTIRADVTGDRVYDDVVVGENYVLLVDKMSCCKRTKRFVVDACDSLVDVMVEDYHRGIYGKEIAVVQSGGSGIFTDIYAYANNRIEQVAFTLPGRVMRDAYGMVFCLEQDHADSTHVSVPHAVSTQGKRLEKMSAISEQDTVIVLEPGGLQRIEFPVTRAACLVLYAASVNGRVGFSLHDQNGEPLAFEHSDGRFVAIVHAAQAEVVELVMDNMVSAVREKVSCITRQYPDNE
jgi:hypothetical protein